MFPGGKKRDKMTHRPRWLEIREVYTIAPNGEVNDDEDSANGGDLVLYANTTIAREARANKFHFRVSEAYDKAIDCKFDSTDDCDSCALRDAIDISRTISAFIRSICRSIIQVTLFSSYETE